jgi:Tfp pilus assembly protein PilN
MKAHVNLLVADLFGEDRFPFQKVALPASFLLLILAILTGTAVEFTRTQSLKKEMKDLNQRKAMITQSLDRIKSETGEVLKRAEATTDSNKEREQLLQQLEQVRVPWADLLREVSVFVPENIWLTRMEGIEELQDGNSSGLTQSVKELKFMGFGTTHTAITQWMLALERSRYFKNVVLVYAEKRTDEGWSKVNFEVQATLR